MNQAKHPRFITLEMILSSTGLTRSSTDSTDEYLERITHLHMQNKRIHRIEGLDSCLNLKVLYLYENQIKTIENLEFAANLQYLQLQNNLIGDIGDCLLQLTNLTKLFLDNNSISFVTGLEACTKLEELHISNQRLPEFTSLSFDPKCIAAFSKTLLVLDISGNSIATLLPFTSLFNARKFLASNNAVADLQDVESIVRFRHLTDADFSGNPCSKFHKYRDYIIAAASDTLVNLDDIPVQKHQQVAIRGLMRHRRTLGSAFPQTKPFSKSQLRPSLDDISTNQSMDESESTDNDLE